jgi:hypothetical protein
MPLPLEPLRQPFFVMGFIKTTNSQTICPELVSNLNPPE